MSALVHSCGQMKPVEATYRWDINEHFCSNCIKPGDKLVSSTFFFNDIKLQIELYPNGDVKEKMGYLSIYSRSKTEYKIGYEYTVYLYDDDDQIINSYHCEYAILQPDEAHRCEQFLKTELLPDSFYIQYKILVDSEAEELNQSRRTDADTPESVCLTELYKISSFESFLNNEKYSDFKFIIGEKTLYVDKGILTHRSKHFESMFNYETRSEVIIADIEYSVFYELLRFLYNGKINEFEECAIDLLIAADKYNLEELKTLCENKICENLTTENAIDVVKIADLHNFDNLKKKVIKFIAKHGKYMNLTEVKSLFLNLNKELMCEIMCSFLQYQKCKKSVDRY